MRMLCEMMFLGQVLSWDSRLYFIPFGGVKVLEVRNLSFRRKLVVLNPHTVLMNSEKQLYLCWVTEERWS